MFQAIVMFFLLTNGIPADTPIGTAVWKDTFPTLEACHEFQESDKGKLAASMVSADPLVVSGKAVVKFDCVAAEDNSI